jgi:hypothetical protein
MTYSAYARSVQPYSCSGDDVRAYFDMTMDLSASLTLVIYVSTAAGYATRPTDALANQPFRGVLQSFSFDRSIMQSDIGQFTTGTGQLVISNEDANYDFLPLSYSIDGRPITIKLGRMTDPYDNAFQIAKLTAADWLIGVDNITIDLVDFSYKLEVPLQPNVYGGTGGADGTSDLAGKRKPLVFGNAMNISPVSLVPSLLIYQAHDGSMASIDAVYDRAAALTPAGDVADYATLAAASVTAGTYVTCLAAGLFKLGSNPAGLVTADVKGANSSGYITTTADIVQWALLNRTALTSSDLDAASFTALNATQPAPIDYFHTRRQPHGRGLHPEPDGRHRRLGRAQARRHLRGAHLPGALLRDGRGELHALGHAFAGHQARGAAAGLYAAAVALARALAALLDDPDDGSRGKRDRGAQGVPGAGRAARGSRLHLDPGRSSLRAGPRSDHGVFLAAGRCAGGGRPPHQSVQDDARDLPHGIAAARDARRYRRCH